MNKCDKLIIKILDTKIQLHEYSDVEDIAKWLNCGTSEHLSVDEIRALKTEVLEHGCPLTYSEKQLKKALSDNRFMLRFGKAVVLCKYLHEFGINIPFRFFVLPDYICNTIAVVLKKIERRIKQ